MGKIEMTWERLAPAGVGAVSMRWLRSSSLLVASVGLAVVASGSPASASAPKDGPAGKSAQIVGWYGSGSNKTPLRAGTTSYGLHHIKIGGGGRKTENHETTSYAKGLWKSAIDNGSRYENKWGGWIYVKKYQTPGGQKRRMCVVTSNRSKDNQDLIFAGENYGTKGIITAYWTTYRGWSGSDTVACDRE
ncbi:hypothetical protein [Kineosporia babensis]|uniref:Uncharacterized protein n=1 Tax=Kineosporia babensis TaxID=499548 RepID=A0A9X1NGC4_9ACTN|nr:hypothetical protein [Kineosporia babensis]MCD5314597.1 hypothetical protein [Kineosporia babensis]